MKKLSLLILLTFAILLSACSNKDEPNLDKIKKEKHSTLGIVEVVENDTFTIRSRDRVRKGQIVITKRMEIEENEVEVNVGDMITVYHDGIEGNTPARINRVYGIEINKEATAESIKNLQDIDDEKQIGYSDVDYYEMSLLKVARGDEVVELTEEQSAVVHDIMNSMEWEEGSLEDFKYDYEIISEERVLATFNSNNHTLNDEFNDIKTVLHEGVSTLLKDALDGDF